MPLRVTEKYQFESQPASTDGTRATSGAPVAQVTINAMPAEPPVASPPRERETKKPCWICKGYPGGDSEGRAACPIHGTAATQRLMSQRLAELEAALKAEIARRIEGAHWYEQQRRDLMDRAESAEEALSEQQTQWKNERAAWSVVDAATRAAIERDTYAKARAAVNAVDLELANMPIRDLASTSIFTVTQRVLAALDALASPETTPDRNRTEICGHLRSIVTLAYNCRTTRLTSPDHALSEIHDLAILLLRLVDPELLERLRKESRVLYEPARS
jgi:hypothetical protein